MTAASGAAVRTRFAPSPTGFLHIGGARTALFNWLLARHEGGRFLLRIEDTDVERSTPEFVDLIFRTLEWLGLDWDDEPVHQSAQAGLAEAAAGRLLEAGHAYYCDCTRDAIDARAKARGGKPGYDGFCRDRGLGPGPDRVVRFRTPDDGVTGFHDTIRGDVAFPNADLEDFVIVRSAGTPMFLLANAVDDAEMGVTHIVRGEDLLNATPKQLLLREALGYPAADELVFGHLPLIVNEQGKKLSKRRDDVAVELYRDRGYLPGALLNYLATLGWGPPDGVEVRPLTEIVELFDLASVTSSSARFDLKKLQSFNGDHIRALPTERFVELAEPFLRGDAGEVPWDGEAYDPAVFAALAPLVQERVKTLAEVPAMVDFLFLPEVEIEQVAWDKVMGKGRPLAEEMLGVAIDGLTSLEPWTAAGINDLVIGYADEHGHARGKAQAPIRVAVTGRTVGPPLWESIELLGRERTLERLRAARERLDG